MSNDKDFLRFAADKTAQLDACADQHMESIKDHIRTLVKSEQGCQILEATWVLLSKGAGDGGDEEVQAFLALREPIRQLVGYAFLSAMSSINHENMGK